ncbi:UDP-N-acetylmuramoyl-L-alanine--D-glutamate ligase [Glaciecola petra]|uniref:UDP-N-acetylmuramoylalanine--D-glutamate ligase n=1 Tax=Glaciecola petra TaxID=3075602 RepID=A0ABU2ZPW3_9ALTE|nr:UDP-N-acetylmuramoyl-L-alanine--D-glutamate ligase [Aestuariibacter sp. P117]MDT0593497.1 UDP-N-acetylmuramoyl-L-alanine--D-glutamate ligase [Aestuariibacter sp. P117]
MDYIVDISVSGFSYPQVEVAVHRTEHQRPISNSVKQRGSISAMDLHGKKIALLGFGVTGRSCAKYLLTKDCELSVFDSQTFKESCTSSDAVKAIPIYSLNEKTSLVTFDLIVVSPGINLNQAYLQDAINAGIHVIGDIELFALALIDLPQIPKIIAITGSNGKSTVVDMLHKAISDCGFNVALGGNFGPPVLDMLSENYTCLEYDYLVLELSSFQLESTYSLCPNIASVLNVTSDHMDRHGNMHAYTEAKQGIYMHAERVIYNREDDLTIPQCKADFNVNAREQSANIRSFGLTQTTNSLDYWQNREGIFQGENQLLSRSDIEGISQYQLLNMQVVLACCEYLGLLNDDNANDKSFRHLVLTSLLNYSGLPHRFKTIYQDKHVSWINDSKATNAGAAAAAIKSVAEQNARLILIAGGDAKGASASEFESVKRLISSHVETLILIGRDANLFVGTSALTRHAADLSEAVEIAKNDVYQSKVVTKTIVLLSPGCASFDMFDSYVHRGNVFTKLVLGQVAA